MLRKVDLRLLGSADQSPPAPRSLRPRFQLHVALLRALLVTPVPDPPQAEEWERKVRVGRMLHAGHIEPGWRPAWEVCFSQQIFFFFGRWNLSLSLSIFVFSFVWRVGCWLDVTQRAVADLAAIRMAGGGGDREDAEEVAAPKAGEGHPAWLGAKLWLQADAKGLCQEGRDWVVR